LVVVIVEEGLPTIVGRGKSRGGRRLASGGDPLTESVKMTKRGGERKRRIFADNGGSETRDLPDKV
jgi:hypothetical protein